MNISVWNTKTFGWDIVITDIVNIRISMPGGEHIDVRQEGPNSVSMATDQQIVVLPRAANLVDIEPRNF
jgi:hypothetical protein